MEQTREFEVVSDGELAVGAGYAEGKIGHVIDADLLRILANDVGNRLDHLSFVNARFYVLNEHHIQDNRQRGILKREAYSVAIGKIFADRNARRTIAAKRRGLPRPRGRQRPTTAPESIAVETDEKGQLVWII